MGQKFDAEIKAVSLYKSLGLLGDKKQQVWVEMRIIADVKHLDFFQRAHQKGELEIEFIEE